MIGMIIAAVASFVSTVCTSISAASAVIGPMVASTSTALVNIAAKVATSLPEVLKTINNVAQIVDVVSNILGIKKENESVGELGAKARVADKPMESFDSTQEYIDYLRNEVKQARESRKDISDEQQAVDDVIGSSILSKAMGENLGLYVTPEFLVECAKQHFSAAETIAYIIAFKDAQFRKMELTDYLSGCLDDLKSDKAHSAMFHAIKSLNPEMGDDDIENKISEMTITNKG